MLSKTQDVENNMRSTQYLSSFFAIISTNIKGKRYAMAHCFEDYIYP